MSWIRALLAPFLAVIDFLSPAVRVILYGRPTLHHSEEVRSLIQDVTAAALIDGVRGGSVLDNSNHKKIDNLLARAWVQLPDGDRARAYRLEQMMGSQNYEMFRALCVQDVLDHRGLLQRYSDSDRVKRLTDALRS